MTSHPHGSLTLATHGGCKCDICRHALSTYHKRWLLERTRGHKHTVPAAPSQRKINALTAIGHTRREIAEEMGCTPQQISRILANEFIRATTASRLDVAYRAMEMRIAPEDLVHNRCRRLALRAGHLPPLAYDDIDKNIVAVVESTRVLPPPDRLDLDEVEYVLQHAAWKHPLSPPEKGEVVKRWVASGRSQNELARLTGWKVNRYFVSTPTKEAS